MAGRAVPAQDRGGSMNGPLRITGKVLQAPPWPKKPELLFPLHLTQTEKRAGLRREKSQRTWILNDMEKRRQRKAAS